MSRKERLVLVVGLVGMLAIWAAAAGVMSGSTHLSGVSMLPTQAVLPTSLPTVIPSMSSPQPAPTIDIAQSAVQPQQDAAAPEAADQRLVVRFVPETDAAARQMYIESIGGTVTREIEALDTVVVTVPDAAVALPASPVMAASEPDYYVSALVDVPTSDTYFSQQWGLSAIGAPDAWQQLPVSAPAVTVAVIDSGICAEHPDLAGRIVAGYDFVEEDAVPQDLLGHGCAVAGVIAANVDNGEGIAGVAPNAQIMPVRVLDAQGIGTYSDVAAAIVYAVDQGAQIINLSLGGTNPSSLLADAVDYAAARDVLVIAAAGNTGREGVLYPAAYDGAVAVGSVDPDLQRSSFSTYGPQIALLAPGRDILTTGSDGAYVTLSGTSLAAPHVTGVAALELALGRSLTVNGGVVSVGGSAAQPATPVPVVIPPQYQDLYDKAANGADLKLIVQLNVPYQSASQLTTAQAAAQQASIQQVRSALINDLAAYSAVIHEGSKTWHLPYLALRAGASAVAYLANSPEITGMAEDRPMVKQLGRSIPFIDADNVYALGYDGSGQVVAILDDGIDAGHEFFGGRVVEEACVSNSYEDPNDRSLCPNNDWLQLGPGAADISRCQLYGDDCDHGTHVAGIAAGNGGPVDVPNGVAKGASIIAVQIFTVTYSCSSAPCYVAYTADQLTAMDYILYLTDSYNIAAVNLSLGTTATYPPSVCINDFLGGLQYTMIDDLSAAGVATVIAAGNNGLAPNYSQGNPNALSFPACLPNSVSVGSVGSYGSMGAISNSVSLFSNDSAELDLLAPGGYIQSAGLNDTYRWDGGTSMAAPHVTGAFAVLKQANPDATVDELLNALKSTGVLVTDFRSSPARIKPRIDLDNALAVIVPPVLVVNKTADTNDGICDADCSLREALTVANGTTGIKETIKFAVGGGGLQTMVLNGATYGPLPAITDPVIIDGTTQPGYSGSPLIEIDGSNVADSTPELNLGLNIPVGNSTVRGLVINRFLYGGIGLTFSGNNILEANYIGTEPDGTTAAPNLYGVIICSSDDNHVGGPLASQRNLISGNLDDGINLCQLPGGLFPVADNNVIQGNYIGVDVTGSARLANGDDGIKIEDAINTLIGGLATGAGNVISGNTNGGVTIIGPVSNGNWIQGNIIGSNAAGTQMLTGNVSNADGIYLSDSSGNLIGGSSDGAGNLISGNLRAIRLVGTSANNDIRGNRIGTNAAGTAALPNQNQIGIILGESGDVGVVDNLVGGTTPGAGNVIAGNQGVGISVVGSSNVIQGNFVGTDASASLDLGNAGSGILLQSDDNLIGGTASGAGNVIAHNAGYGIGIGGAAPADLIANTILSNRIFNHDALGLDLNLDGVTANDSGDDDTGPNNLQNFPVLTEVTASLNQAAISGTLNSTPNSTFRVELFLNDSCDSSGYGEGQTFLGGFDDVATDGSGSAAFSFELFGAFSAGSQVTATATSVDDDTSEFSACEPVVLDPNILVVNTTSGVNDGVCDAQCSLADAIAVSNGMPGAQTVIFEIPGSAPYTIQPTAVLPTFGDLTIDGTTQPGYAGSPIIVLDGSFFTSGFVHGLTVNSNSTIRGMVIHSFRGYGIKLLGNDNIVQGNYLGIDVTGTLEQGNYEGGVDASGHNNLIGGTTAAARNVISGNGRYGVFIGGNAVTSYANTVQGNYIGTNATGTAAIPNGYYGILVIHSDNVIGGTTGVTVGGPCSGACNLISGNTWDGIYIQDQISNEGIEADYNTIQGNFIGTDVTGTSAIPNGRSGILLYKDTKFNLIGGTDSGAGNLIAGNTRHGIEINGDIETRSNTIQGNRIGTNAAGTAKIPNGQNGFLLAADTTLNIIGGSDSGAGNLISGNTLAGISLDDARNNTIEGNQVGTNLAGTTALSNGGAGISLANGADTNQIGGADSGESNLISGNGGSGVVIDGSGTNANVLAGNFIGTDVAGMTAIANVSYGVQIKGGADLTVIENNLISGNGSTGMTIQSGISQDNSVTGNYIGTKVGGTAALPNAGHGVEVGGNATLVDGNVISGNTGSGVFITSTRDVSIQGNMIGMAGDTVSPLGNGQHGIRITNSNSSLIGTLAPNRIGANGADGIYVESGSWNRVDGRNEFRSNGGLGIDLGPDGVTPNDSGDGDSGANGLQNFPVLTEVHAVAPNLVLKGTLNSAPNQTFTLHFYQSQICDPSGYGEGEVSIDADTDVTTDGSGNASFTAQAAWDTAMNDRFISVFAVDTSGNTSEFSTCEAITPFVATPVNFTATVLSEIDIQLAWVDQSVDETEWIIERSLTGKNQWTELTRFETEDDTGTGAVVTYDDATFLCSRSYDYRLRAYNETGGFYSVYTPVQTAVPNCPALNPPDDFTAVASSPNQIDLAWTDTNTTETGYRIDHSTDGSTTWKLLLIVPANTESYAHTNLICNTGHSYRLRAVRSDDNAFSDYTPVQTATTLTCPVLAAPLNPAANALSRSEIQFSWEDGSPGQTTRFDVERSSDGTTWVSLTSVAPSTTRITDTNLACGQAYSYRVRAFRVSDSSYSPYSSEVSTSTNACAAAVTHTVGLYQAGIWQFWQTNAGGSPAITFNFGPQQTGWQPVVGDWDGDGTDGIGVYQNGAWLLRNATSGGSVDVTIVFGPAEAGWQPVVGDWDGDGTDGIGLYKNGLWLLRQTATSGSPTTTFAFGPAEAGWLPVAGDWNGSGLATVGLYKDGLWLLSNRMPAVSDVPPFVYASAGWVPVVGDWNEDRQETAGAYQNGVWQLRQSNSGGMPDVNFAVSVGGGWQPLASVYEGGMGPLSILAVAPTTSAPATSTPTATPVATVEATASVEPTELPTTATEPVEVTDEASPEATQEVVVPDTATPTPTPTETDLPTATPTEEPTATPVPAQSDSTEEPQS